MYDDVELIFLWYEGILKQKTELFGPQESEREREREGERERETMISLINAHHKYIHYLFIDCTKCDRKPESVPTPESRTIPERMKTWPSETMQDQFLRFNLLLREIEKLKQQKSFLKSISRRPRSIPDGL